MAIFKGLKYFYIIVPDGIGVDPSLEDSWDYLR